MYVRVTAGVGSEGLSLSVAVGVGHVATAPLGEVASRGPMSVGMPWSVGLSAFAEDAAESRQAATARTTEQRCPMRLPLNPHPGMPNIIHRRRERHY